MDDCIRQEAEESSKPIFFFLSKLNSNKIYLPLVITARKKQTVTDCSEVLGQF